MEVIGELGEIACRRQYRDRRQPHLRSFYYAFIKSRRRTDRRGLIEQARNYYSDRYSPSIVTAAMAMMLLCVADTVLTLSLIERGASELNPFLAALLDRGFMWFFAPKYVVTSLCVCTLVVHTRFSVFGMKGYHLLLLSILMYTLLINYQIAMLLNVSS